MKARWITYMLLLGCLSLHAQTPKSDALFVSLEAMPLIGNAIGADLSLNYQLKQSFSFNLGMYTCSGLMKEFDARQEVKGYHFKLGKVFTTKSEYVRWNLSAGIGYSHSTYPIRSVKTQRTGWLFIPFTYTHNEVTYEDSKKIIFIFNPKLELPISKVIGFHFSAIYMTNKTRPVLGLGFGLIVGNLR